MLYAIAMVWEPGCVVSPNMDSIRPSRGLIQRLLVVALALGFGLCLVPANAQEERPVLAVLKAAGEFLLDAVKDYGVHESLDRTMGFITHRKELADVERELQSSLNDVRQNTGTEIAQLREELSATRAQLHALNQLQQSGLTRTDLDKLYQEIRQAQASVDDVLQDHEKRISDLQRELTSLRSEVASLETQLSTQRGSADSQLRLPSTPGRRGIDCSRARPGAEQLICGNRVLLDVDHEMSRIYYTLHDDLLYSVNKFAAHELTQEQLQWINWRNDQLVSRCARGDIVDLSCAVPLWQSRIDQLTKALNTTKNAALR